MTHCSICIKYTGKSVHHGDTGCPLAASLLCRRCHHRGHLANACTYGTAPQWERPSTLEELIPSDIRLRYGINTSTRLDFQTATCTPESETELSSINTIYIPDDYAQLGDFVKRHKIVVEKNTKAAACAFVAAIKEWGVKRGLRIVIGVSKKNATSGLAAVSESAENTAPLVVNEVYASA